MEFDNLLVIRMWHSVSFLMEVGMLKYELKPLMTVTLMTVLLSEK